MKDIKILHLATKQLGNTAQILVENGFPVGQVEKLFELVGKNLAKDSGALPTNFYRELSEKLR